ncbi:MAG: SIMPL domain-containing protein [Gemmatimonadetes bacterium]|nr:SIMPL domain-containing protein [Gemmatimonadota bacterium]
MVLVLVPAQARAQVAAQPHEATPQVVVSGRGEVRVTPDRALLSLTVETRRPTAAAASQENARLQRLVFDTLRAAGIAAVDLSTTDYSVAPEQRWNQQKQQSELLGYIVRNTIRVRILNLELVGRVIDAALSKGSNQVSSLEFSASNVESSRRQALALAVEQARADAEVMAKAAGGSIAGLLEISSIDGESPPIAPMRVMSMAARGAESVETPISAGPQTLVVRVSTRWRFAPAAR